MIKARYIKIVWIFRSTLNEGDVHGNGDDVADNEQRIKISNATVPYLEHLHKLLIDPPYVRTTLNFFCINFQFLSLPRNLYEYIYLFIYLCVYVV